MDGIRSMSRYKFFWQGCKDGNAGVGYLGYLFQTGGLIGCKCWMFQVANLMQSRTLEVFFRTPPASLQGIRSRTFIIMGTQSCSLAGFPIILFLVGRWGCPRGTMGCTPPIFVVNHIKFWPHLVHQQSIAEGHWTSCCQLRSCQ